MYVGFSRSKLLKIKKNDYFIQIIDCCLLAGLSFLTDKMDKFNSLGFNLQGKNKNVA